MHLFLATDMAAVTSHANQQYCSSLISGLFLGMYIDRSLTSVVVVVHETIPQTFLI